MEAAPTPQHSAAATTPAEAEGGNRRYTTISIPQPLYQEIKKAIEGTGFRSPTEFLVYVTRLSLQSPLVKEDARVRGPPFFAPR
jgi:hypothetical protein